MKYRKDLEEYYLLHKLLKKDELLIDKKYLEEYKKFFLFLLKDENIFNYFYKNNTSGNIHIKKEIFDIKLREYSIFNNNLNLFLPDQNSKINFNVLEFENLTNDDIIDVKNFIIDFNNDIEHKFIKTKKRVFSNKDYFDKEKFENNNNDFFDLEELFKFKHINHKNFKYYKFIFDILRSKNFSLHNKCCYIKKENDNGFKSLISKQSILNHNNNYKIKKAIKLILDNFKTINYKSYEILNNEDLNFTSIKTKINSNNNNFNKNYIHYNSFLNNEYFTELEKKEITDFIFRNKNNIDFIFINDDEIHMPYESFMKVLSKNKINENFKNGDDIIHKFKYFFKKRKKHFYDIIKENKITTNGKIFNILKSNFSFLKSEDELKKEESISNGSFKKEKEKKLKNELEKIHENLNDVKDKYKDMWIGSVDTEYNIDNNKALIYEIGYTLKNIKNKKLISRHFIIKDNMRVGRQIKSFNFGLSEVVDLNFAFSEMNKDFKNVQLLIGNNIDSDKKILELAGFIIPNKKLFELNDFPTYFEEKKNQYDLETFLIYSKIKYSNLHNAGNDSYYSVGTFIELIKKFDSNKFSKDDLLNVEKNRNKPKKDLTVINKLKKRKHLFLKKEFYKENEFVKKDLVEMKFTELYLLFDIKNAIFNTYIKEKKIRNKMQKIETINFLRNEMERFINKNKMNFIFEKKVPFCDIDSMILIFNHFKDSLIISNIDFNEIFKIRSKFSNFIEEPKKNEIIFVDLENVNEEQSKKFKDMENKIKKENIIYQKKNRKYHSDETYELK